MASTKTWALLTQSLFISMVGAERFISTELETSLRKGGADDLRAIFKENDNIICGGTEIHDELTKDTTVGGMRTINWEKIMTPTSVYLDKVGLGQSEKEKCQAAIAALEEFKQQMLVLGQDIDDAFKKRTALAHKVEGAMEDLDEMFEKQDGLTELELQWLHKLELNVKVVNGLKAEMASIKEQESALSASLSVVVGALKEATSKLDAAMGGNFEPDTPEAGLKQLSETLTTKNVEMKKTLDGLVAKKKSTGRALMLAMKELAGTQNEVNVAKGDVKASKEAIEKAEGDGDTLNGLLAEAEQAYISAKQAYEAMYKKGSNLAL